ncbi:M48 family metalloprotease [Candidatus Roizmanbacteria bacterium]|nr:M48 family metalloprotease [Candidatus Roizmanbacteria bacterium]
MLITYLFSIIIFLLIGNFYQLKIFLSAFIHRRHKITVITDRWITQTIKKKTSLALKRLIIFEDQKPYGMMPGLPIKPTMILSRGLYETFTRDELEWVILHEAGHWVLRHGLKAGAIQLAFLITGLWIMVLFHFAAVLSVLTACLFSLLAIRTIRRLIEYDADRYSIERVSNPQGVITAQAKFRQAYKNNWENRLSRLLFSWNVYPSERIKMAKKQISNR